MTVPKALFSRFVAICICISMLTTSARTQTHTDCVELGGGSEMCLDDNGDVDWLACEVDGCRFTWEPAAPQHLNILDQAIAEEGKIVGTFPNSETDIVRIALRQKHEAALANLVFFRSKVRAAIKSTLQTQNW